MTPFQTILKQYRDSSFSERNKGDRFERLMQSYLKTDPQYASLFKVVYMWNDFPFKQKFGGRDIGIDLVALTTMGDYWAIQCKFFETSTIDKNSVDTFLTASSKQFYNEQRQRWFGFTQRLWISTTNKWSDNAEETIKNQQPPVNRINLYDLEQAPVDWEKLQKGLMGDDARSAKKSLREHQKTALNKTHDYFKNNDRGKLIMACGTGKTFTSLKIAKNETGSQGVVLFLVPSIALLGQSLREWTADAECPIYPIAICSDSGVTKKRNSDDDTRLDSVVDLTLPASTDPKKLRVNFEHYQQKQAQEKGMLVVFSTYQSIDVVAKAQEKLKTEFDLIICDEAHRTTGVSLSKKDESAFTKVHDNDIVKAQKRLYMTATPRLYDDNSKSKAARNDAIICSMDDEAIYGKEIYRMGFGEAVEKGLLTDYKVLTLAINEKDVPASVQNMISDENKEITSDDASKLIGCINAMSKQILGDEELLKNSDPEPMKRAVAFCQDIKISKKITSAFNELATELVKDRNKMVSVTSKHIDGSMKAPHRDRLLNWLKSENNKQECKVLTNVRCLSEGVDVPSLDAVLFLSAKNSQIDVVQSVGRVMRKSHGKKYGYIVIPVVIPYDVEPFKALDNNEKYKVIWTVLNALRAHDERFNATINKIELNKKKPDQILIGEVSHGRDDDDTDNLTDNKEIAQQLKIQFQELQGIIYAKMVQKVGDRVYWEKWAKDVAQIAEKQIGRITHLVEENTEHKNAFENFLKGLQQNINPSIVKEQAIEMLSQHIITRPVFETLFEGYSFVENNPVSKAMQAMMNILENTRIEKDTETLQKFYQSVKTRAAGIDNAEGKQRIIIELYDKFFKTAFPKMVEQLGIVYTPVEVVDFIIHSVNDVLKKEFNRTLSDKNVHILDPFTGTGTFITRLLQSGLIHQKDLPRKYNQELHANEIVLLAYYIAAVNIENAYHDQIQQKEYSPFEGIVFTDTFQLGETDNSKKLFSEMFPQNSERVQKQKEKPITVIIGNPPYSVGQRSANDNAQNQKYKKLDSRIENTYAKESNAGLNKSLYDSYIKAFRWSTDRLNQEQGGIIAFVTNSGWLDGNSTDGFRKTIEKEFSSIYVFNLRGGIRGKIGEDAKREGQNVFNIMTGVAVTILVKKPNHTGKAQIQYHDIGDYLNRKEKINIISGFKSIAKLSLQTLIPNKEGDWINQRNTLFETFIPMEPKKKLDFKNQSFFNTYAVGISTNRDIWVYSFSKKQLENNITKMIAFYNQQTKDYQNALQKNKDLKIESFISNDETKIKWTRALRRSGANNEIYNFEKKEITESFYRPYCKQRLYFHKPFIESSGLSSEFFLNNKIENFVICVSQSFKDGSVLITDCITDLHYNGDTQCFPLYYYKKREPSQQKFRFYDEKQGKEEYIRRDGISDFILDRAIGQYGKSVTKEDIFYYVYGILHSPSYRETFKNDLKKMLPRIPLVDKPKDFWDFSKAGRDLAELHINYEQVATTGTGVILVFNTIPAEEIEKSIAGKEMETINHEVQKMRFAKKTQEGSSKKVADKSTIIYNSQITLNEIPLKAYEYVVNGKSAIEWIMERYQVKTDKKSGISNNPNDWAKEVGEPKYILNLLLSIINVSLQTVDIVEGLPKLEFDKE